MQSVTAQAQAVRPKVAAWHDLAGIIYSSRPTSSSGSWACPFAVQQALAKGVAVQSPMQAVLCFLGGTNYIITLWLSGLPFCTGN